MTPIGLEIPAVLLPSPSVDLQKWAVVACDQFTSQPEYWAETARIVGGAPSTHELVFPEVFLGRDDEVRIPKIQAAMRDYLARGLLVERRGVVLVRRTTQGPHGPRVRSGLVAAVDLERYDYSKGSTSLVRATEGTILDRLPPRIRIREGAPLELPHVMLLIDDPSRTVIEPLALREASLEVAYDTELMQGGGHITGKWLDDAGARDAFAAIGALAEPRAFREKYGFSEDRPVLLFAVGDGNHSLATAKAVWEKQKAAGAGADHPARYALVEIVNLHDDGLEFEPIHRVVFELRRDFLELVAQKIGKSAAFVPCERVEAIARVLKAGGTHRVAVIREGGDGVLEFSSPTHSLPVGSLQPLLDDLLATGGAEGIDYVHGTDAVLELGTKPKNMGLFLPPMPKGDLFKTVIVDGALPRKTFSMGEAFEKRYYLEARKILG